jgi:cytochrome c553
MAQDTTFRPVAVASGLVIIIGLTLATTAVWSAGTAQTGGNAAHGKQLFYAHACYGCHGYNGETGARDLVGTGSPIVEDEATFRLFLRLRADQAPELPSTRMPNFSAAALSDADVHDLFAFIRGLRANAPRIEDVPTLRRILNIAARPASASSRPASPVPSTAPAR